MRQQILICVCNYKNKTGRDIVFVGVTWVDAKKNTNVNEKSPRFIKEGTFLGIKNNTLKELILNSDADAIQLIDLYWIWKDGLYGKRSWSSINQNESLFIKHSTKFSLDISSKVIEETFDPNTKSQLQAMSILPVNIGPLLQNGTPTGHIAPEVFQRININTFTFLNALFGNMPNPDLNDLRERYYWRLIFCRCCTAKILGNPSDAVAYGRLPLSYLFPEYGDQVFAVDNPDFYNIEKMNDFAKILKLIERTEVSASSSASILINEKGEKVEKE